MRMGDPVSSRCPQCGGRDLLLFEAFTVYHTVEVVAGRVVDHTGPGIPAPTRRWSGECQREACGHRWPLRRSPLAAQHEGSSPLQPDVKTDF